MLSCESAVGCSSPAALSVSLLVPTGEVIDSGTGSAPVLKAVVSKRLCSLCAAPVAAAGLLARALGCHLDIEPLVTGRSMRKALAPAVQRFSNALASIVKPPEDAR